MSRKLEAEDIMHGGGWRKDARRRRRTASGADRRLLKFEGRITSSAIQCRFIWGDEEGKRRSHLVKWEDVKLAANLGVLDIRSLIKMNTALQEKLLWRYFREDDRMWEKIIDTRWGCLMGDERGSEVAVPHGRGLWKMIGLGLFRNLKNASLGKWGGGIKFFFERMSGREGVGSRMCIRRFMLLLRPNTSGLMKLIVLGLVVRGGM